MSRTLLLAGLVSFTLVAGCGRKAIDHEARFDTKIEESWTKDSKWVNAVKHLSTGGTFIDTGEPEEPALDVPHVLPVLQRLGGEFGLEWQAITDERNPTQAVAIVAQLPDGSASIREKLELAMKREQEAFPGAILYQWGHRWVAINFLNQKDAEIIEQGTK